MPIIINTTFIKIGKTQAIETPQQFWIQTLRSTMRLINPVDTGLSNPDTTTPFNDSGGQVVGTHKLATLAS